MDDDQSSTIKVRRIKDLPPVERARAMAENAAMHVAHGPEYCDQPMLCIICMFPHQPNLTPPANDP